MQSSREIPIAETVEPREEIKASTLPYHVDLVNLDRASPALVKKVEDDGILWKGCENEWKT
ncbi:hypothetical protein [Lentibacillus halodurans]|uniref:hypothetical protein n=1 Tax=Lentibacillus halodurans TaxID=237679 RepID=UPI00147BC7DA